MSVERIENGCSLVFRCDGCSEYRAFGGSGEDAPAIDGKGTPEFQACLDVLKDDGWVVFKTGDFHDPFGHFCPSCGEK